MLAAISQESEDVRGEHGVGKPRVCSRVRRSRSCEAGAARGSKFRCDPPPPQDRFRIDRRKGTQLAGRFTAAVMVLLLAAASATVPIRSQPAAAQASSARSLVVAWGGSLSDVGTAASLVAAGEGVAVVYAQSPQSLGLESAALVAQVAPGRVLLVGGTAVLAPSIDEELRGLVDGIAIERLAGSTRIETAALAAERVLGTQETVVLANGWSLPDVGAAASAVASGTADAVLYASRDGLGADTRRVLSDRRPSAVLIAGGPAALSNSVAAEAANAAGTDPRRLGGATRVETAASIARQAFEAGAEVAVIANGWSLDDVGIAASLAAGLGDAAVLYAATADELGAATRDALAGRPLSRSFIVGLPAMVSTPTFARISQTVPATRIVDAVHAARTVLNLAGAPEGLNVIESRTVGPAGATIEGGGVRVVVPESAVSDGTEVRIREQPGQISTTWSVLEVVEVDSTEPVDRPITVSWDVSELSESELDSLLLLRWDDSLGEWVSGYVDYEIRDGRLIAETDRWSLLALARKAYESLKCAAEVLVQDPRCVAEAVVEHVDPRYLSNFLQSGRELLGRGVDRPQCKPEGQPHWVRAAGNPEEDSDLGRLSAFRLCYQKKGGDGLTLRAAANGVLSYYAYADASQDWGDVWSDPSLDEDLPSIVSIVHSAAHKLLSNDDRVFVPALKTAEVGIERPDDVGLHTATFEGRLEPANFLADLSVFVVSAIPFEKIDPRLAEAIELLFKCGRPQLRAAWKLIFGSDPWITKSKQALQAIADLITKCGEKILEALAKRAEKSYGKGTKAAASIPDTGLMQQRLASANKYLKIAEGGGYVIELAARLSQDATTWQIKANGKGIPRLERPQVTVDSGAGWVSAEWSVRDSNSRIDRWEVSFSGEGHRLFRDPSKTSLRWTDLAAGTYTLRVRAGNEVGWSDWRLVIVKVSSAQASSYVSVSSGANHACALRVDGRAVCWGEDTVGKLDAPDDIFTAISAGGDDTCGILTSGAIKCWGRDGRAWTDALEGTFTAVSVGIHYGCGIRTSGEVHCWGRGHRGHVPEGKFTAISAYLWTTCGLRIDGRVTCWGENGIGQRDNPPGEFTQVSMGGIHGCGLRKTGMIECWPGGRPQGGWFGRTEVPQGEYISVSAGDHHTCAIRTDHRVVCWGNERDGASAPPGNARFASISASADRIDGFTCGIRTDGRLQCWGNDNRLELLGDPPS